MATLFESLLSKVDGWGRGSAERNGRVHWPENMVAYLEKEFHLLPKDMVALRCVRRQSSFGGLPVTFVRICDLALACEQGITVKDYRDLDGHPELVLFEGYVLKDGTVHLRKKEAVFT
jgi:hypothetical protein